MKIKYILRNKHTNQLHVKIQELELIERGGLKDLFDVDNYEIVARLRFAGFTIKGNDELYENDLIENDGEMFRIEFLDGSWECINIVNGENIALSELASSRDTCLQGNIYQHPELINK